jgi:hypothetical protein
VYSSLDRFFFLDLIYSVNSIKSYSFIRCGIVVPNRSESESESDDNNKTRQVWVETMISQRVEFLGLRRRDSQRVWSWSKTIIKHVWSWSIEKRDSDKLAYRAHNY